MMEDSKNNPEESEGQMSDNEEAQNNETPEIRPQDDGDSSGKTDEGEKDQTSDQAPVDQEKTDQEAPQEDRNEEPPIESSTSDETNSVNKSVGEEFESELVSYEEDLLGNEAVRERGNGLKPGHKGDCGGFRSR